MSAPEALYALARVGDTRVVLPAALVREVGPPAADATTVALARQLGAAPSRQPHALRLDEVWLLVDPGLRFVHLDAVRPLPRWLRPLAAPLRGVAQLEDGFAFELDVARVLEAADG